MPPPPPPAVLSLLSSIQWMNEWVNESSLEKRRNEINFRPVKEKWKKKRIYDILELKLKCSREILRKINETIDNFVKSIAHEKVEKESWRLKRIKYIESTMKETNESIHTEWRKWIHTFELKWTQWISWSVFWKDKVEKFIHA